jgi:uncharacterized protein (TIGR04255 family)
MTIPGRIYEKVRYEFPIIEQGRLQILPPPPSDKSQFVDIIRFFSNDKKIFIQVFQNILTINCLKPYPSWNGFKPKIEKAFNALNSSMDVKGFHRISLRYVNNIEIPEEPLNLKKYFKFRPTLGDSLPEDPTNFIMGCVFPYSEGQDACKIELTNAVVVKPETQSIFLDLEYYYNGKNAITSVEAIAWIDQAHNKIKQVFEGCITDRLRGLFKEVK